MGTNRVLVVYCHPNPKSFTSALRDCVIETLESSGHDVRQFDLYAMNFNPVMCAHEREGYHTPGDNVRPVAEHVAAIKWANALVFVYPTWWFGLPAMLKGWLDRVWIPHETFTMPTETTPIKPAMQHINKIGVITCCGAPWWVSKLMGEPGRKTIIRGIGALCEKPCNRFYMAHYKMDTSTGESRKAYLDKVRKRMLAF